ncbi:MAG: S-layer homology domain-containing protein [Clostridia bacterium]|nr:S-layer homology domain-containing protein [Clostridia bacterium]
MSVLKKTLSLILVASMLFALIASMTFSASALEPLPLVRQDQAQWKNYYYGSGNLYNTGCGIFSLVNAVGYLTGLRMSVTSTASWFHSIGGYNVTGGEGTYRTVVYPKVQAKYGSTYGFTVDCGSGNTGYWETSSSSRLKSHLANGGVAVCHVPGHFIALVDYDYNTNKYHVYDSFPTTARPTGTGDCWKTPSQMATGKLDIDWFCLLSATGTPADEQVAWEPGNYEMLGVKYLRDSASASAGTIVNVPKGEVLAITAIENGSFGKTQYGDYVGYIKLDEDVKRVGDLNTSLKATITSPDFRLADTDYTASWNDVAGASGYRYRVLQLDGLPDPSNDLESDNATVLAEQISWIDQTTSVTIPAASMTNGKYLKIAVQTWFGSESTWAIKYVTPSRVPFADVPVDSWMYDPVVYCYENNYLKGVDASTFAPSNSVTRAMAVTIIHRLAGEPAPSGSVALPFTDVPADAWYTQALAWCYENKIVAGIDATTFGPDATVTREQATAFLYRYANFESLSTELNDPFCLLYFDDSDEIREVFYDNMMWAVEKGIIIGDNAMLRPGDATNRAELAVMIYNYANFRNATAPDDPGVTE